MVIGERFAWAHLPKAGGNATLEMFKLFPEIIVHADDPTTNRKHDPFDARSAEVRGKVLVMNIRRLPGWIVSYAHQIARGGLYPDYRPLPMPSREELVESTAPDDTLSYLMGRGRYRVERWLRMEHLSTDFGRFVAELTNVSPAQRQALASFPLVNAAEYDHDVSAWLSRAEIEAVYRRNPLWAACERQAYAGWRSALSNGLASAWWRRGGRH